MQPTIKDLRRRGYKVRVMHTREYWTKARATGHSKEVHARGGSTTIELTTPDNQQTVSGKAVCSDDDNFNRKVGNAIALGRALNKLQNNFS